MRKRGDGDEPLPPLAPVGRESGCLTQARIKTVQQRCGSLPAIWRSSQRMPAVASRAQHHMVPFVPFSLEVTALHAVIDFEMSDDRPGGLAPEQPALLGHERLALAPAHDPDRRALRIPRRGNQRL